MDLDEIVANERGKLVAAAVEGKFGDLSEIYTANERAVLDIASYVQIGVDYLGKGLSRLKKIPSTLLGLVGKLNINVKFVDEEQEKGVEEGLEESDEQAGAPEPEQVEHLQVYEPETREKESVILSLYERVHAYVNNRVAREVIPRTYARLRQAEETLAKNIVEIERNLGVYRTRRDDIQEMAIGIGRDLGKRESELRELERREGTLESDYQAALAEADKCLSAGHYGTPEAEAEAQRSRRIAAVLQQELYTAQRDYTALDEALLRDKTVLTQYKAEVQIIDEGVRMLEGVYSTVQANKRGVIEARAVLEQKTATMQAWEEALEFGQSVPQPAEVGSIVGYIESGIQSLKGTYEQSFDVKVIPDKPQQVIQKDMVR